MADGTLIFDTKVDSKGVETGVKGLGDAASSALKVTTAAIAAGSAAVGKVVKDSVEAFSNYEQLVGGIETLFKNDAEAMETYAANAFKTAGMSANTYMETVTSFSASLLQSLEGNTKDAVEYANLAVTDMSDNANKMGSDITSIQNAYQGFAKMNYTMLDNLKLGYGGTKEEMQRLIDDANKLRKEQGLNADLTISSFADIVTAIHEVQTNLDITGTTAKEAATTIQGSFASLKGAWVNMLVGLADDTQDFDKLVDDLVTSAKTVLDNVMPRIVTAIKGAASLIKELAPLIAEYLPQLISDIMPELLSAGVQLVAALVEGISMALPQIAATVPTMIETIANAFASNPDAFAKMGLAFITLFAGNLIKDAALGLLKNAGMSLISTLVTSIGSAVAGALPAIIGVGTSIITAIGGALTAAIPVLLAALPIIIAALVVGFAVYFFMFTDTGKGIVEKIKDGIVHAWETVKNAVGGWVKDLWSKFMSFVSDFLQIGTEYITKIGDAIRSAWEALVSSVGGLVSNLVNGFLNFASMLMQVGSEFIGNIVTKFTEGWNNLVSSVSGFVSNLVTKFMSFAQQVWNIGKNYIEGFFKALNSAWNSLVSSVGGLVTKLATTFSNGVKEFANIGKNVVQGLWDGISNGWKWLTDKVKNLANDLLDAAKDALGIHSPSKAFEEIGKQCVAGFDKGADDLMSGDAISNGINASLGTIKANVTGVGGIAGGTEYNQTINVNQQISTPDELARAIRLESKYGLMRGVALA